MFSYVDASIREKLEKDDRLVDLDQEGNVVNRDEVEPYITLLGPIPLPRMIRGEEVVLSWYPFVRRIQLSNVLASAKQVEGKNGDAFRDLLQTNMSVNSVLACPGFLSSENPLVRVHSCCMTGDVFGSRRCECGPQLETAFENIMDEGGGGAVVYMSGHEGRGIGLWAKAVTYLLQDDGQDTYQANVSLGLPEDSRDFTDAAVALRYLLKGRAIRLMSNNLLKVEQLEKAGQRVSGTVPHLAGVCDHNRRYMRSKRLKGHILPQDL